ncbi:MAG: NAD-dependent epimerase/dehydratase family protein [Myxococcales bacterium]|nr:NAD-dependent epimerase/dehydratase family protein [Myxococcales bacterium]
MDSFLTPSLADSSAWRAKRVVVTGGGGFIGSHLVERLLPVCGQVVVPTRQGAAPGFLRHVENDVEFVHGDLRDPAVAASACRGADVVMMLAAVVGGIEYNMAHQGSVFRDNLAVYLATLEAARLAQVGRVLVTSSACVYPRFCKLPTPESEGFEGRPEPTNAGYGWAKRMEEFLAGAYANEFGMSVAVARPYNAYGPRDDFDPASSHVIPALVRKAFEPGGGELVVWGSGRQSRSFLYVTDFADGLIRICERAPDAEPTNVGADEETTIGAVAEAIARLAGTGKRVVFDTGKPEGQPRRHCDVARLESLYDFRARVPLADGLARTVEYFREELLQ